MSTRSKPASKTWRSTHGDLTDEEWLLICDLFPSYTGNGEIGRPQTVAKRDVINAILYVAATGCQWRALPSNYPNWNTVHRYHLRWSKDGTWKRVVERLTKIVREHDGRDPDPSGSVIDARSVRGACTVTSSTRGYDAGKKVSGRKTFGIVDTMGLLLGVVVVAASVSDNAGGILVTHQAKERSERLSKIFCDSGFKKTFIDECRRHHISTEVVRRIHAHHFEVLPKRWVVERTWSWLMNNRRLQIDYERDPRISEGFIWAAHARMLLRRLTEPTTS
ncbi:MAG: IS5 family transposase [Acidimicrobiales bacterium]